MASILQVEQIKGPTSGASANKITVDSDQTLAIDGTIGGTASIPAARLSGTLPALDGSSLTGVVPDDIPIFSAYSPTNGTFSENVYTVVTFGTKQYDTASAYNTSNGRFTPQVAGYYWIGCSFEHNATTRQIVRIIKHSSSNEDYYMWDTPLSTSVGVDLTASTLMYLNGSTDYVDVQIYGSGGSYTLTTGIGRAMFQGYLVRKA